LKFLLDTNAVSALMREDHGLEEWLFSLPAGDTVVLSTIVRGEVLFGIERLPDGRRRADLDAKARRLFSALECESIPPAAADCYSRANAAQRRLGLAVDENDLWIAATALALDATLVTRDQDFCRLADLRVVQP